MLLFPKKPKFIKSFSSKQISKQTKNKRNSPTYSSLILVAAQSGFLTNFQISAIYKYLRKFTKRQGQIFLKNFPSIPITKKPSETRLGRGKGQTRY